MTEGVATTQPMIPDLVSTIIPVYNRAGLLDEAVRSVLSQTYRPIEIIIVDDGSTDDTAAFAQSLARAHPGVVTTLRVPNRGPGLAREAGRLAARGEFIQYLDSDDLLLPDKFRLQVEALRQNPDCGIAYGITSLIDESGQVLMTPYKWSGKRFDRLFPALLVDRWWNTHTPLFRRAVCDAAGPWTGMRMGEDWEYEGRIAASGVRLVHCPEPVSCHRTHQQPRLTGQPDPLAHSLDLARLIGSLHASAMKAGVPPDCAEMRHFARWAFLIARRAGAAGLMSESRQCLEVARCASDGRRAYQFSLYRMAAGVLGWNRVGRIAMLAERALRSGRSRDGMPLSWAES